MFYSDKMIQVINFLQKRLMESDFYSRYVCDIVDSQFIHKFCLSEIEPLLEDLVASQSIYSYQVENVTTQEKINEGFFVYKVFVKLDPKVVLSE